MTLSENLNLLCYHNRHSLPTCSINRSIDLFVISSATKAMHVVLSNLEQEGFVRRRNEESGLSYRDSKTYRLFDDLFATSIAISYCRQDYK